MYLKLIKLFNNPRNSPRNIVFEQFPEEFNTNGLAQTVLGKNISQIIQQIAIKSFLDKINSNKTIDIELAGIAGSYSRKYSRSGIFPLNISHQDIGSLFDYKIAYFQSQRMGMNFISEEKGKKYLLYPSDIDLVFKFTAVEDLFFDLTDNISLNIFNKYGVYIEGISFIQNDPLHQNKRLLEYTIPDFLKDK